MSVIEREYDLQLRIGAVSYLNTKPLVYNLSEILPSCELTFDYPSQLADSLALEQLDVALVPAIELANHPEWTIISDACIGCLGPVLSVKVLFRKKPAEVRSLALDEGSRTSAVLAQILLHELYAIQPHCEPLPLGGELKDTKADAILLIGDRAIKCPEEAFCEVWDLGDRWCRWAELPFVFAYWVARAGIHAEEIGKALSAARDQGCLNIQTIVNERSQKMELPRKLVEEYLCRNLHFQLGYLQRKGLELYFLKAAQLGFIQDYPRVFIDDCKIEH